MTTSAPAISARIHSLNRPNLVSIGTIVWLSSELMFFAGLFGVYFTVRAHNVGEWPPPPTELDIPYALVVTIVLVASSFTCQYGVFAAELLDELEAESPELIGKLFEGRRRRRVERPEEVLLGLE